jgi:hypothetical protein
MSADILQQDSFRGPASCFLGDDLQPELAANAPLDAEGGMSDADFVGLSVGDFDLGEEMQLEGFPVDLWAGVVEESLGKCDLAADCSSVHSPSHFRDFLLWSPVTIGGPQSDICDERYRTEPDLKTSDIGLKRTESDSMPNI